MIFFSIKHVVYLFNEARCDHDNLIMIGFVLYLQLKKEEGPIKSKRLASFNKNTKRFTLKNPFPLFQERVSALHAVGR